VTVLRFGLTRFAQSNADWYEKAERAEQCGFDVLWAPDHLFHFQRPDEAVLDGWVTVAAWAAITTRIRIGTLITTSRGAHRCWLLAPRRPSTRFRADGSNWVSAPVRSTIKRWQECSRCHRANGLRGLLKAQR